jgi:hypothetical protein
MGSHPFLCVIAWHVETEDQADYCANTIELRFKSILTMHLNL